MRAKMTNGPHGGYRFSAEQRPLDSDANITGQRILWGEYDNRSAREILEEIGGKAEGAQASLRRAAAFVSEALIDGEPHMAAEVIAKGVAAGFNERTLRRGFETAGGLAERLGFGKGGTWIWQLPRPDAAWPS
jgi:hypothetical protein